VIGSRLGPYEITAKLGEGGMGVVFKARDFQLGREVALKVLPEGFIQEPERLARFEREARLLAQLNHPNIAQIYGFEVQGDCRALVMELVEGPTLAERLEQGPLPFHESLSVSLQIAHALEEAHEKGIVHRDLKPQNIKASIEGKVKVLDFGLAKAMDPTGAGGVGSGAGSPSQLAQSPTLTLGATQMGVILGTAAYMSPEQAKGLAVDKRADVWAFGVVLYEMLTGARLFGGETVPETLAGVIRAEIDLAALPAETPAALRRLLERCLERDPRRRLRDIGEARLLLEQPFEELTAPATTANAPRWRERAAWAAAVAGLAVAGWALARSGAAPAIGAAAASPVTRFHLLPPEGIAFNSTDGPVMLSPDGSSIVFRIEPEDGKSQLAVRRLDSFEILRLPGTDGSYEPSWSPDGRYILFFGRQVMKIDAGGLQPPQALAPVSDGRGAAWSRDGTILFAAAPGSGLSRVSAEGGEVLPVTTVDRERGESAHLRPLFLPDGERFLYVVKSERAEVAGLYAGSLDGKLKKRVLPLAIGARFAEPDVLLLVQDGRLVARRLNLETLEISGEARTIAEGVDYVTQFDLPPVTVSISGRLVFHRPSKVELRQVRRIGFGGEVLESLGEPGDVNLDLSPDGRRLATQRLGADRKLSIWIRDLERGVVSRLTGEEFAMGPVWSPDGRSIAYVMPEATVPRLMVRPAAGGAARLVYEEVLLIEPIDWSPDGRSILIEVGSPGERSNLLLVPADGSGSVTPFAKSAASEHSGRFSPDGDFLAYVSDEAGQEQIYVEPLPQTGTRWLASPRAGNAPRWNGNGLELLYVEAGERAGASTLMAVAVTRRGAELEFGAARALGPVPSIDYEPLPGRREILVGAPVEEGEDPPPVVIDNWPALLPPR
jgi:Tol biopolymer transport system component